MRVAQVTSYNLDGTSVYASSPLHFAVDSVPRCVVERKRGLCWGLLTYACSVKRLGSLGNKRRVVFMRRARSYLTMPEAAEGCLDEDV